MSSVEYGQKSTSHLLKNFTKPITSWDTNCHQRRICTVHIRTLFQQTLALLMIGMKNAHAPTKKYPLWISDTRANGARAYWLTTAGH